MGMQSDTSLSRTLRCPRCHQQFETMRRFRVACTECGHEWEEESHRTTADNIADPQKRIRLEAFLRAAAGANAVHIRKLYRLSGGAVQENWAIDADMTGGTQPGPHQWVLRTDAAARVEASLKRAEEFEILRVAHLHGLHAPQPLWLCRDTAITGREFFIMQRLPGIASGHCVTGEPELVPGGALLARELATNLARL